MSFLQDLENTILDRLKRLFDRFLSPLRRLFNAVKSFFTAFVDLIPETVHLVHLTIDEVNAWRNFREEINFKTGVVSLQSVRDHISDLIGEVIDAYHAMLSIWSGSRINPLQQINEASAALADVIEEFGRIGRLTEFLRDVGPKLERLGGKLFEVFAIIQAIAETILDVVRKLTTIVQAVRDVRETFETGEGLFLPQTNKRRTVRLADGTSMKIRVGNLHS